MATKTPEQVVDFSKLDAKAKLAQFIEATKSDEFKDIDLIKELHIKVPEPEIVDKAVKNEEAIKEKLEVYEKTRGELADLGHKFEKTAKLSEAEQIIYDKIEKNSQAKLQESVDELEKLDTDFPSEEIINKMSIGTEEKIVVAAGYKEMVVRNSDAITKIKKELDTATSELTDARLNAPETVEDKTGDERVSAMMESLEIELKADGKKPAEPKKKEE